MPQHRSADDGEVRLALVIARRLEREQRNTIGELEDELRDLGMNPAELIAQLRRSGLIRVGRTVSMTPERGLKYSVRDRLPQARPNLEALAVLEGPIRGHIRATLKIDGSWIEETVRLPSAAMAAVERVVQAVEAEDSRLSAADFAQCRQALSGILFADRATAALRSLVRRGQTVDLRLLPAGNLVEWPWEAATQEPRVDDLCDTGLVGVTRLAAPSATPPTVAVARPGRADMVRFDAWVDYVCLDHELDITGSLQPWHEDRVRAVDGTELWKGSRPEPPADVMVLTAHGKLYDDGGRSHPERILRVLSPERHRDTSRGDTGRGDTSRGDTSRGDTWLGCPLRVEVGGRDQLAAEVRNRILTRAPRLAMLGICYSATESAAVPSLGRLLASAGVPHVFAFRGKVDVEVVHQFTNRLTAELQLGRLPTHAAAAGRQAIDRRLGRTQLVVYGG